LLVDSVINQLMAQVDRQNFAEVAEPELVPLKADLIPLAQDRITVEHPIVVDLPEVAEVVVVVKVANWVLKA
jgi:Txe/YoeB family toxin of Txe-Axe toxin-antitoxin module